MAATTATIDPQEQPQRGTKKFIKILPKRYNSGSAPHFHSRKSGHTHANQTIKIKVDKKIDNATVGKHVERKHQRRRGSKASVGASDGVTRRRRLPKARLRDATITDQCSKVVQSRGKEQGVSVVQKLSLPSRDAKDENNEERVVASVCNMLAEVGVSSSKKNTEAIVPVDLHEVENRKALFSNGKHRASKKDDCNTRKPSKQGQGLRNNKVECSKEGQDKLHPKGPCGTQKKSIHKETSISSTSTSSTASESSIDNDSGTSTIKLKCTTLRSTRKTLDDSNMTKKKGPNSNDHAHHLSDQAKKEVGFLLDGNDGNSPKSQRPSHCSNRELVLHSNPVRRRGRSLPHSSRKKVAIQQGDQHGRSSRCDNKELALYPTRRGRSLSKLRVNKVAMPHPPEDHDSTTKKHITIVSPHQKPHRRHRNKSHHHHVH